MLQTCNHISCTFGKEWQRFRHPGSEGIQTGCPYKAQRRRSRIAGEHIHMIDISTAKRLQGLIRFERRIEQIPERLGINRGKPRRDDLSGGDQQPIRLPPQGIGRFDTGRQTGFEENEIEAPVGNRRRKIGEFHFGVSHAFRHLFRRRRIPSQRTNRRPELTHQLRRGTDIAGTNGILERTDRKPSRSVRKVKQPVTVGWIIACHLVQHPGENFRRS